jgi:hypothetical protein
MKRIFSLIIAFLFVFNLLPSVFAAQTETIDINCFDNFSIEQVQKTFSNTITQNTKSDTQDSNEQDFLFNAFVYNVQDMSFTELNNVFFSENINSVVNYLHQYKLFEKNNLDYGISQYKINLNSYIATVLVDVYGAAVYCI